MDDVVEPKLNVTALIERNRERNRINEQEKLVRLGYQPCPSGCEAFDDKRIRNDKQELIDRANEVINEYSAQGFRLTLRQLFYQFVSRGWLPNTQPAYSWLGKAIGDGRNLGQVPWDEIEDRTRFVRDCTTWRDPKECIKAAAQQYKENLWRIQPYRPEVWIEKDALVGVIEGICEEYRVPYLSCRGYCSDPVMYQAAQRFRAQIAQKQTPIVLHLGDHDPSGLQMTRDITSKLRKFTRGIDIIVKRVALNEDQTEGLPPNPVKDTDTRSATYKEDFGNGCWELDALDPDVIVGLVRDELEEIVDEDAWEWAKAKEKANRERMMAMEWNEPEGD
jgi:hypothetical protein